jgi:hypothetical protein
MFRRNGGWKRLQGELSVYYWPRIAGSEIADNTEAVYFRNGYLNIKAENPALAHELSLLSTEIVKRYNQKLGNGAIKGIRVKIGTLDRKNKPIIHKEISEIKPINNAQRHIIDTCVNEIHDPEIAEILSRTMHQAFSHNQQILDDGGHPCRSCQTIIDLEFDYCPCCERKIKEETKAYLDYLKKNNRELKIDDLKVLDGAGHLFLHELDRMK